MKHLDEYRDGELAQSLLREIEKSTTRNWSLMEICGGQTHSLLRTGIDQLLPKEINLIHGPGCPVCVTPLNAIDKAIALAGRPDVIFTSYGDMLRVPGSQEDLFSVRARGGDVRVVYSPLDSVKIAEENPDRQVIFFAIGFETTAPANAAALLQAHQRKLENFSILLSHVTVPAALQAILDFDEVRVDAVLAAGHVCTVMGYWEYDPIAETFKVPIVVTGFEPVDLLNGILLCIRQLESGRALVENAYSRSVSREGNQWAQQTIDEVFEISDRQWRGLGMIPLSGYQLRPKYAHFDAEERFPDLQSINTAESSLCISGKVLQGIVKPPDCPAFGRECTPQSPLGATMVSSEGACAAYYRYRPQEIESEPA